MIYTLHPYEGISTAGKSLLPFGASRAAVQDFFGTPPEIIQTYPHYDARSSKERFFDSIMVHYKDEQFFEFIEFADLFSAAHTLDFQGHLLLKNSYIIDKALLQSLDPKAVVAEDGVVSLALGVGLWINFDPADPDYPEDALRVSNNFYAFRRNYFTTLHQFENP
jgi:hypothetical protein